MNLRAHGKGLHLNTKWLLTETRWGACSCLKACLLVNKLQQIALYVALRNHIWMSVQAFLQDCALVWHIWGLWRQFLWTVTWFWRWFAHKCINSDVKSGSSDVASVCAKLCLYPLLSLPPPPFYLALIKLRAGNVTSHRDEELLP